MEHPTDGRPRLFLTGPGASVAAALSALALPLGGLIPDGLVFGPEREPSPRGRRVEPIRKGWNGRGGKTYASGRFKGSAEAKRATRRGGNPARSKRAGRPAPERPMTLDFVKAVIK